MSPLRQVTGDGWPPGTAHSQLLVSTERQHKAWEGAQGALVAGEKGLKEQPVPTFPSIMGVNRNPTVFTNVSEVVGSARTRAGALAPGPT